jgi:thiol-disulfide isomerase/thioredoxin
MIDMKFRVSLFALALAAFAISTGADEKNLLPNSPEDAWKAVETAAKPPPLPAEWGGKAPTPEQKEAFQKILAQKSVEAAQKAREFHTRFPDHGKAAEAKTREKRFIQQALNWGATDLPKEFGGTLSEEEQIATKLNAVNRQAIAKQAEGRPAMIKVLESGLRELMREFPKNATLWSQMMIVVQSSEDLDHKKKILGEISAAEAADEQTKERAKGMMHALEAVGHPLEIAFTATDGSSVDIQKMKGKVVLLDFWASWCGPCIASLPEVIELHQNYHPKGLEIIGINLDKDREAMDSAISKFEIPWRQYFDGKGWGNRFVLEYSVNAIPSMWLVDKRGVLRTMEARENLEERVKELLAEPPSRERQEAL